MKLFIKLENLLEEQKTDLHVDFFSFNEDMNQKIEIFILEFKNKQKFGLTPEIKISKKNPPILFLAKFLKIAQ